MKNIKSVILAWMDIVGKMVLWIFKRFSVLPETVSKKENLLYGCSLKVLDLTYFPIFIFPPISIQ